MVESASSTCHGEQQPPVQQLSCPVVCKLQSVLGSEAFACTSICYPRIPKDPALDSSFQRPH